MASYAQQRHIVMRSNGSFSLSRRQLLQTASASAVGLTLAAASSSAATLDPALIDRGGVAGGKVQLPNIGAGGEVEEGPAPSPLPPSERVGFCVVALGRLSLDQILPAFAQSKKAKLAALVSGSPDKLKTVASHYGVGPQNLYNYDTFDRISENPAVKAVYVVLPNALHREFVIRAAKAGKHVLTEKPMAASSAQAQEMITACKAAGVKLMVAYRCQYEPNNRELIKLVRSGKLGKTKIIEAKNFQNQGSPDQWRLHKDLSGGGSLPDIGLYCLNTTRAILGEEPIQIEAQTYATPNDPRFREVEESVSWLMRFPSGVMASCSASYGAHKLRNITAAMEDGSAFLQNAFDYQGQQLYVTRKRDEFDDTSYVQVTARNQFALELDHMATSIIENKEPRTPGQEGLQDHLLMEAIYKSAETRTPVTLPASNAKDATRGPEPDGSM